jgi:hypothetical protein
MSSTGREALRVQKEPLNNSQEIMSSNWQRSTYNYSRESKGAIDWEPPTKGALE